MKKKQGNRNDLLLEAFKIGYRLRSTFFYRKVNEYGTYTFSEILKQIAHLSKNYDWKKSKEWGISEEAFKQINKTSLSLIQVFAHPRLLREHPNLTAYYRNVSALSQKSVSYLIKVNVNRFENKNPLAMNETEATSLSRLFNEHISLIIESALERFSNKELYGLLFASTGAQIDGSWRNAIGIEAEKIVQKLFIKEAIDRKQLNTFLLKDNSKSVEQVDLTNIGKQLDRCEEFRGFSLTNQKTVLFSSEPDISLLDKNGNTLAVIEVKGGTDPAGALERYGAAKKSFEASLRSNQKTFTILLASCITDEVDRRVKTDKTIKKYYNLTSLLIKDEHKKNFLKWVFNEFLC